MGTLFQASSTHPTPQLCWAPGDPHTHWKVETVTLMPPNSTFTALGSREAFLTDVSDRPKDKEDLRGLCCLLQAWSLIPQGKTQSLSEGLLEPEW